MSKLFNFDVASYYNWKNRIIMKFLQNYFSKDELLEIVNNNGKLEKLEIIKNLTVDELKDSVNFSRIQTTINSLRGKLKLLRNRGSILYLLVILQNENKIQTHKELFKFLAMKLEPRNFIDAIKLSIEELKYVEFQGIKTDNFVRKGFSKKLNDDLINYFTNDDIDFILNYRYYFEKELYKILKD